MCHVKDLLILPLVVQVRLCQYFKRCACSLRALLATSLKPLLCVGKYWRAVLLRIPVLATLYCMRSEHSLLPWKPTCKLLCPLNLDPQRHSACMSDVRHA